MKTALFAIPRPSLSARAHRHISRYYLVVNADTVIAFHYVKNDAIMYPLKFMLFLLNVTTTSVDGLAQSGLIKKG